MKVAASIHTDPIVVPDCPVLDGTANTQFQAAFKAANELSLALLEFLKRKEPHARAAWLRTSINASRALFQPWGPELVYTIASLGEARFNQLQELLGLSSRTLSDKLKSLREEGLVERRIADEEPVRISYVLTKHGRKTAAAATPLFTLLGHEARSQALKPGR
jgi:DNA-binding HxlR family transcriptional regulator